MISNGKRNLEWVVLLHDIGKDVIPNDVTTNDIFPSLLTFANIAIDIFFMCFHICVQILAYLFSSI